MKQWIFLSVILFMSISSSAQQSRTNTSNNYVSDIFKGINIEMPGYREIHSGTKIIVDYAPEVPAEMRGAFEYAVKLWEEVLPLSLPIKIYVKYELLKTFSSGQLSKVVFPSTTYNGDLVNMYSCPSSMVKSVVMQEYVCGYQACFGNAILNESELEQTDIIITYNSKMYDEIDFSLDGDIDSSKYDFVTVALRDIAIGFGFTSNFTVDTTSKTFDFTDEPLTPFESLVVEALGTKSPTVAFANATKGKLTIPMRGSSGIQTSSLDVYAPETWEYERSLRYLIPDSSPISKLLTYDFGKGYIMRDLTGVNWDDVFCGALNWRKHILVGAAPGTISSTGSTDDVIPYKGLVTLKFDSERSSVSKNTDSIPNVSDTSDKLDTERSEKINKEYSGSVNLDMYCRKYDPFLPSGPDDGGLSLSVLKKDGTWDYIYDDNYVEEITLNIETLKLNFDESEYARGTSGGLRYRLTKCKYYYDERFKKYHQEYDVKYFTRDFTPQIPVVKYSRLHNDDFKSSGIMLNQNNDDDYFVDAEIGLANIEGVKRVIVEQLDEGETLPFQYEVSDFRKGYFIANLDKKLSTQLTVIAYNDNGYRRSNTIVVPALKKDLDISFIRYNNEIIILGISEDDLIAHDLCYTLRKISSPETTLRKYKLRTNSIPIGHLPIGNHILSIYENDKLIATYKFQVTLDSHL